MKEKLLASDTSIMKMKMTIGRGVAISLT